LLTKEAGKALFASRTPLGPILGTGGLAMIIPPSNLAVPMAGVASIDVGRLLDSGVIPGFLLSFLYCGMIAFQLFLDPTGAPSYKSRARLGAKSSTPFASTSCRRGVPGRRLHHPGHRDAVGGAAFGVLGVLILAAGFRLLTWNAIWVSLESTMKVAGMVFFIIISSSVFSQLVAYSGASIGLLSWVTSLDLSDTVMLLCMFAVLLRLGLFVLLCLEMSQTTPPFGLLLYIMLGVAP
jgi:TRAP-type mannitol/chloroaromatic compound transport system permease large subunit